MSEISNISQKHREASQTIEELRFLDKPTPTEREETDYLIRTVMKPLKEAMAEVLIRRPLDPIKLLSDYLRSYAINTTEKIKREMIAEENKRVLEDEIEWNIQLQGNYQSTVIINDELETRRLAAEEEARQEKERIRVEEMTDNSAEVVFQEPMDNHVIDEVVDTLDMETEEEEKKTAEEEEEEDKDQDDASATGEEKGVEEQDNNEEETEV